MFEAPNDYDLADELDRWELKDFFERAKNND